MVPPVGDVVEVGRVEGVVAIVQRPLPARRTKPAKYMVAKNNSTTLNSKNKPVFTTSGLPEGNSHELVNPAIRPLCALPGALKLPNPWHGDAGSGQTVKDPLISKRWQGKQEKRKEDFHQHLASLVLLQSGTGETLWPPKLNTLPYLAVTLCMCPHNSLIKYTAQFNNLPFAAPQKADPAFVGLGHYLTCLTRQKKQF